MRAIWSGSLAFGLINIPIRVYPGSEEHEIQFHLLHKKDLSPIRYSRICKEEEEEVAYKDVVKGFEYEKGEYVVVTDEDFIAANAKKTSTVEIQQFTKIETINPLYFEKPYFLEPEKKSVKAYQLLAKALLKSGKVAIANYVFRNREHIGAILATPEGLVLMQMRYHAEIRPMDELNIPQEKTTPKELEMALSFIDQLTKPFDPEKFHDTYVEELMELIEQKLKGKKVATKTKKTAPSYQAKDLMHLLQASMKPPTTKRRRPHH